jgi:hypothetical protein
MNHQFTKRLAIFVEGQTESLLIERLIKELAGNKGLTLEIQRAEGGGKSGLTRSVRSVILRNLNSHESRYYVLIRSSENDERVVSDIREEAINLAKKGYKQIIGLRDVYPKKYADIERMKSAMNETLRQANTLLPCNVFLSVMEIEAWFLAEECHYQEIDQALTPNLIKCQTGIDVMGNMELIEHPSESLDQIYRIVGKSYKKRRNKIQNIVNKLNIENFFFCVPKRLPNLGKFIEELDTFFD